MGSHEYTVVSMGSAKAVRALVAPFRKRLEPSLIVIGAMKAGTSSLYTMLSAHPRVVTPQRKELHFFNRDTEYERGMYHYRSMFPLRPIRMGRFVTFEASPSYLPHEKVALRIARHYPEALLVAILRDPVERAYSAWNMYHTADQRPGSTMVHDPRSFAQAVDDELAGRPALLQHRYLQMGDYATDLVPYLHAFRREDLLLFGYPRFKERPAELVNTIFQRWGLPPLDPSHKVFTTRVNAKPYSEPMDAELKARLYAYFAPRIARLNDLLGEDLQIMEAR